MCPRLGKVTELVQVSKGARPPICFILNTHITLPGKPPCSILTQNVPNILLTVGAQRNVSNGRKSIKKNDSYDYFPPHTHTHRQRLLILPRGLIMSQSLTASSRVFRLVSLTLRRQQLLGQCVERQVPGVCVSFCVCMSVLVCIQAHMPMCADARG